MSETLVDPNEQGIVSMGSVPSLQSTLMGYGLSGLTVLLAFAVKLLLDLRIANDQAPYLLFSAAVMVSAWSSGFGPGIFALVLSSAVGSFFFVEPKFLPTIDDVGAAIDFILFNLQGILIVVLCERFHRIRRTANNSMVHARESLQAHWESESRFQRLIESGLIGVYTTDHHEGTRIFEANDAFLDLIRADRSDLESGRLDERGLVTTTGHRTLEEAYGQIWTQGRCRPYEAVWRRRDGSTVPVYVSSLRLDETGLLTTSFVLDLTERKRIERELLQAKESAERAQELAERSSQAKTLFLAKVSHELRTPLNAIMGMTQLTMEESLPANTRASLETVAESSQVLLDLVNDLLDHASIESSQAALDPSEFAIRTMLEQLVRSVALRTGNRDVEIILDADFHLPEVVIGDELRIRQVLSNLLTNAIKYTERGEVLLRIDVDDIASERFRVNFAVIDTGIGIPPEKLNEIFEPFTQVDRWITRRQGGVGLGLTIARQLVRMMGGELRVESQPGSGSTFRFTIPLSKPRQVTPTEGMPAAELDGLRVLVIEDNASNSAMLQAMLSHLGLVVEVSSDADAAMRILQQTHEDRKPFACLLVDVGLPDADGLQMIERIRDDKGVTCPILLMSPLANRRHLIPRLDAIAPAQILDKPVTRKATVEALQTVLWGEGTTQTKSENQSPFDMLEAPLNVLVVEDTPASQNLVRTVLTRHGHRVEVVGDGQEAVERARSGEFHVILMDIQLPILDGVQATRLIRIHETEEAHRTPIIAMTAHDPTNRRQHYRMVGMDDYLAKPLEITKLLRTVERHGRDAQHRCSGSNALPHADPRSDYDPVESSDGSGLSQDDTPQPSRSRDPFVLDRDEILSRFEHDRLLCRDMIQFFIDDFPGMIQEMEVASKSGDAPALRAAAHKFKGLVGNFGETPVKRRAIEIEDRAEHGRLPTLEEIGRLRPLSEQLIAILERAF